MTNTNRTAPNADLAAGYRIDAARARAMAKEMRADAEWWAEKMGADDGGVAECLAEAERYERRARRYDAKAEMYAGR